MAVLATYGTFRDVFTIKALTPGLGGITFQAPETITRLPGFTFTADGFLPGQRLEVFGTASNDGMKGRIASVADQEMIMEDHLIVNEAPGTATLIGKFIDNDGTPWWPLRMVRANGFDGTVTGIPSKAVTLPFTVTCNTTAADAVFGTDEYDWYLSQNTDQPAYKHVVVTQKTNTQTESYSGTIVLSIGLVPPGFVGTLRTVEIFRNTWLYVKRRSDGAIQAIDMHRTMVGGL